MIRSLRRTHRWLFVVLGGVLPALFAVALLARGPEPWLGRVPASLGEFVRPRTEDVEGALVPIAPGLSVRRASRGSPAGADALIEIAVDADRVPPDLLLYWCQVALDDASGVPADAILIGAVGGSSRMRFALPPEARDTGHGTLLFFSLAHGTRAGSVAVAELALGAVIE